MALVEVGEAGLGVEPVARKHILGGAAQQLEQLGFAREALGRPFTPLTQAENYTLSYTLFK